MTALEPTHYEPPWLRPVWENSRLSNVRDALLRLKEIERRDSELAEVVTDIAVRYGAERDKLKAERDTIRQWVTDWIQGEHDGEPVRLPDVGTAYLVHHQPSVEVDDPKLFRAWCLEMGHVRREPVPDDKAGKERALKTALETGELAPGTVVKPERFGLAVRS